VTDRDKQYNSDLGIAAPTVLQQIARDIHADRKRDGDNPLDVQVAGSHYKSKAIQPVEYIHANNLGFLEGCIVKRITRWRDKPAADRFEDLRKIKHEVDLLIELESKGT
jgi:hypothetical protein